MRFKGFGCASVCALALTLNFVRGSSAKADDDLWPTEAFQGPSDAHPRIASQTSMPGSGGMMGTRYSSSDVPRPELLSRLEEAEAEVRELRIMLGMNSEPTIAQAPAVPYLEPGPLPPSPVGTPTWVLLAPYLWAPAMKGSVTARGQTVPVDLSLSDLIDLIDEVNGAFQGHVEVGKGPWGLIIDGMLIRLTPEGSVPLGELKVDSSMSIFELLATYRIVDLWWAEAPDRRLSFDLLGGARYYDITSGIEIDGAGPIGLVVDVEESNQWVDLVVGGRVRIDLLDALAGWVRFDVGGFDIGTSSKLAWNLIAGLEYECSPCSSLMAGYRIFDVEESKGSGDDEFEFDVRMQGPFIALGFRF
jgi:hypothetical protein